MRIVVLTLALASCTAAGPAACAENNAPKWAKPGVYVYRISTPDEAKCLDNVQAGLKITANLLDGGVRQIPIINGIIGHDHPGTCNWDGLWPCWNRVTCRGGDWKRLSAFMRQARDASDAYPTFHVNLTDVDVGLRDYPESRAFFRKLVETRSIYRREWNPATHARDRGPPSVPQTIPTKDGPVEIFALVNYRRFWQSGLARRMIDEFYARLPYAPPLLYLDVLTLGGGNFATGFPDGPLGGSAATQAAGRKAIVTYLRSKGTEVATEGSGTMHDIDGTYAWLHGRGYSDNDYRRLAGGYFIPYVEQTFGSMGAFNVSPVASSSVGTAVPARGGSRQTGKQSTGPCYTPLRPTDGRRQTTSDHQSHGHAVTASPSSLCVGARKITPPPIEKRCQEPLLGPRTRKGVRNRY